MNRKWLIIPLATGSLIADLIGAMTRAHNEIGKYATPKETVASKVTESLGIEDEQAVKDNLIQAPTKSEWKDLSIVGTTWLKQMR